MPNWHNGHAWKMRVTSWSSNRLVISSSAAWVIITAEPTTSGEEFSVEWSIIHYVDTDTTVGRRRYTRDDLEMAFELGLSGAAVRQGLFYRDGRHLNIPCRGTGDDGDPNVSILVTDEMKIAVRRLLS